MAFYAVPVLAFVEADNLDDAYAKVSDRLSTHAFVRDEKMPCLLDEVLDGFAYDPETTEVYSALDWPENQKKARS
jgi:hypothetical protein